MSQTVDILSQRQEELSIPPTDLLSYNLLKSFNEKAEELRTKISTIETNDISLYIVNYKTYEQTADFRKKINEMKLNRQQFMSSVDNTSQNSLILNELDKQITELEEELATKICFMNQEKIKLQKINEQLCKELDDQLEELKVRFQTIQREMDIETAVSTGSNATILESRYIPFLSHLQNEMMTLEKLQLNQWKAQNSEQALGEMLGNHGIKFTSSGKLFTESGDRISFHTAEKRGIFASLGEAMNKVVSYVKSQEIRFNTPPSTPSTASVEFSQDVRYLKQNVGKALTLALAEIMAIHPTDPIHYLGHYLFKYRYNQEVEKTKKAEIDDLNYERNRLSKERWHLFIEEEARNAVLNMVIRVEEMMYEKEMQRIADDMLKAAEEEGEGGMPDEERLLQEEAKDKFV